MPTSNYKQQREFMVKHHLEGRDIRDKRVINAMRQVPREKFVPPEYKNSAYTDHPLPIGHNQTISQPYIVALMCQLLELKGNEKVLDVGAGSGYQTAVLSKLAKKVIAIELLPELAKKAEKNIRLVGIGNTKIIHGDGSKGYKDEAPFDAIKSAAASDHVPHAWKKQLKEGGRIVLPLKTGFMQTLVRITKDNGEFEREDITGVRFVPLMRKNLNSKS